MKKQILALLGAVVATAGLAQEITPVWYEHINELYNVNPADKLPILRIQNGTDFLNNFGHGDVQLDCYAKFLKYDDDHYLLGIRENGITESDANLSADERALAQAWPDRTILWINAHNGKVLGIALTMPVFPVQNSVQNNSDAWWKWGIDSAAAGQRVIYSTYRYKILRWAPNGTVPDPNFPGGRPVWSSTPTVAWIEPVPGEPNPTYPPLNKFVPAIHYAGGDSGVNFNTPGLPPPTDPSDPNYLKYVGSSGGDGNDSWRFKAFRVTGSGTSTKLWAGGATWRQSMLEQEFVTDDGLTFYPIARLNDRGDGWGAKDNYGLGGEPSSIRTNSDGRSWTIQGHYPGTGWGARPGRYTKDPSATDDVGRDQTVVPAIDANDGGPNHKSRPHYYDPDGRAAGGLPAFDWDSAGTKGNPPPNWAVDNETRYAGNWVMGIDTKDSLDYIVTYSMPSWNDAIGTDPTTGKPFKTPGWIGVHDLDGNIPPGNSGYRLNFRENDEVPATYGDVGVDYNYDGDVEVYPDPSAPPGSHRSLVLWCGANFGFGVFTVEDKPIVGHLASPSDVTTVENRDVTLTASFNGSGGPIFYKWQQDAGGGNFVDIPGKSGNVAKLGQFKPFNLFFPTAQTSVSGNYRVVLTNPFGNVTSQVAHVTVAVDNVAPVPVSATSIDGTTVDICFDELIDPRPVSPPGTATDIFAYTISGGSGASGAVLLGDGKTVRLTGVDPALSGPFTVTVANVADVTLRNAIPGAGVTVSGTVLGLAETSIGTNPQGNYYVCDNGVINVDAGGGDVGGNSDGINFLYQQVTGDFDYAVRVESVTQPNNRDGIMVRQTLDQDAIMVAQLMQGGGEPGSGVVGYSGVGPFHRDAAGGNVNWVPPHNDWDYSFSLPYVWLRIQRLGTTFNFFKSHDGMNWVADGSIASTMTDPVYVGLATDNGGNLTTLTHARYSGFGSTITTAGLTVNGQTTISVCFPMCVTAPGGLGAEDYFNYTINGGAVDIVPPAVLLSDNRTVLLNVTGLTGNSYTLDIAGQNISTCDGGALAPVSLVGAVGSSLNIQDIGTPSIAGTAFTCGPGQIGLIAGGNAYGGTNDQVELASETLDGDFDKMVQITGLTPSDPTDNLARGGIMARASADPGDPVLAILATQPAGDNAVRIVLRADTARRYDDVDRGLGGVSNNIPNQWLRLKRVGNSFRAYVGTNGMDWVMVAQSWREMPASMLVGPFAAVSKDGGTVTAQFSNYGDVDLGDVTPPTLVSVGSLDKKVVGVKFSESINSATATTLANYAVLNANNSPATITGAQVGIEGDEVYLSVTGLTSDTFTVNVLGGVTDSAGNVIASSTAAGKVQPWTSDDIGLIQNPLSRPTPGDDPGRVGTAVAVSSDDAPEVEIVGGGSNLWDAGDYGHYLHKTVTGDFDMMVEVTRYDRCYITGGYPNAGLMLRNSLYNAGEEMTANGTKAPYYGNITYSEADASGWAALAIWRNTAHDGTHDSLGDGGEQCCFNVNRGDLINGINGTFGTLRAANASGTPIANSSPIGARWLRIKRVGNHFTSYASFDGAVWRNYEELDHPMNATVEVGMFTMNDSGASTPPNNAYDGGSQRPSHYSVIHVKRFGATPALNLVTLSGNSATLSWSSGTLQTAPGITGPWTDAANQSNPQTVASFNVNLDGAQDGVVSPATGSGTITLSGNSITFNNITYSGLSANSIAAHIHGPGAPGVSVGVLYPLFPTYTTVGSTAGAFNGTLPLVAGTGGYNLAQQLLQLESGLWYLNVHTSTHTGGEIRGQILPGAMQFFRLKVN